MMMILCLLSMIKIIVKKWLKHYLFAISTNPSHGLKDDADPTVFIFSSGFYLSVRVEYIQYFQASSDLHFNLWILFEERILIEDTLAPVTEVSAGVRDGEDDENWWRLQTRDTCQQRSWHWPWSGFVKSEETVFLDHPDHCKYWSLNQKYLLIVFLSIYE